MDFFHGSAVAKQDIFNINGEKVVNVGDGGILTSYLPEEETFAVYYGDKKWFTFKESENTFLEKFDVIKDDA